MMRLSVFFRRAPAYLVLLSRLVGYIVGIAVLASVTVASLNHFALTLSREAKPLADGIAAAPGDTVVKARTIVEAKQDVLADQWGQHPPTRRSWDDGRASSRSDYGQRSNLARAPDSYGFLGWGERQHARERYRDRGDWDDDDDERVRPRPVAQTYRTMCVRTCDGFYFPISFAATRDRFARDEAKCQSSCGSEARLFVYRNPGEEPEQMVDLRGQPYSRLKTAFLYRTTYNESCQCRPQPWDDASIEQHRIYALEDRRKNGDKTVAQELDALREKQKQAAIGRRNQKKANAALAASTYGAVANAGGPGAPPPAATTPNRTSPRLPNNERAFEEGDATPDAVSSRTERSKRASRAQPRDEAPSTSRSASGSDIQAYWRRLFDR